MLGLQELHSLEGGRDREEGREGGGRDREEGGRREGERRREGGRDREEGREEEGREEGGREGERREEGEGLGLVHTIRHSFEALIVVFFLHSYSALNAFLHECGVD